MALSIGSEQPKPRRMLDAVPLRVPEGWFAALVPLIPLPLSQRERPDYLHAIQHLVGALRGTGNRSVFLELEELHRDGKIREISRNGTLWSPEMGMGVEPDQAPPRLWTFAELSERDVKAGIPALVRNVMHLEADEAGCAHAVESMCGTGGLLQVLHAGSAIDLLEQWKSVLLPNIEEDALRAFPFYVPLLTSAALGNANAEQLSSWFGAAEVYIRESPADKGLLVLARRPITALLRGAGIALPAETALSTPSEDD